MTSQVALVHGDDPQQMVDRAMELLGGVQAVIPPGRRIVLKPNAGHEGGPETAVNTSPAFLRAVIRMVKRSNPRSITVAEASAVGCKTMTCLEDSGLLAVAREEGVDEIIDIKSYKNLVRKDVEQPTSKIERVDLPDFLLDEDTFFVNLPIFKSHTSMVFSCALKNLKGVVQDRHHVVMHTTNLAGALADLGAVIQPDLNLVDMIDPMEGFGPHAGTPVHVGCVLAGTDMVAIDATACRIAGLELEKVDYFEAVAKKGLGTYDEAEIEVLGDTIAMVQKDLFMPYLEGFDAFPEYAVHVGMACSTCQGLTSFNLTRLRSLGHYERCAGSQIVLGGFAGGRLPEDLDYSKPVFLMGRCACKYAKRVEEAGGTAVLTEGCPPPEPTLSWALMDGKAMQIPDLAAIRTPWMKLAAGLKLMSVRARSNRETKLFMRWLKEQSRD